MQTAPCPASVRQALIDAGLADGTTVFTALDGGRTNRLWRFAQADRMLVCKLFQNGATPLFPNDAQAEANALAHLAGTGLAPDLLAQCRCEVGEILVYRHVSGPCWSGDVAAVAQALNRLHAIPAPAGMRRITSSAADILSQGVAMLGRQRVKAKQLTDLRPTVTEPTAASPVFLHGDVVAQNIIVTATGLCLIDWQCPALGDATEDLAIFLSPAMQLAYGQRVLTEAEETAFLDAYGHPERCQRYQDLAPAYHWRMAAYCLWKAERGDAIYGDGFMLELERLKALQQPDRQSRRQRTGDHP